MIPGAFDVITAKEFIGHFISEKLEAKAREDADLDNYYPPERRNNTYLIELTGIMKIIIYDHQWIKRVHRNYRKGKYRNFWNEFK